MDKIRIATSSDKLSILQFCKNTFSWGDYIEHVWDFWISEGNLLLFEKQSPVGICHAFCTKNQVWIEGIRVNPNFRREGIASNLVSHAEFIGKENGALISYMLIEVGNSNSLFMSQSLGYEKLQTWNFYSLEAMKKSDYSISYENKVDMHLMQFYVNSWRWFPIDVESLSLLSKENRIIKSSLDGKESIAIITDSKHFDHTLIVTLFSGSDNTTKEVLSFLQNLGNEKNYERIQILTQEKIMSFDSLDYRISFNLMKKTLV